MALDNVLTIRSCARVTTPIPTLPVSPSKPWKNGKSPSGRAYTTSMYLALLHLYLGLHSLFNDHIVLIYRSGVMCLSAPTSAEGHHFVEQAYINCTASNLPCARLNNEADIARAFAERLDAPAGGYDGKKGYLNTTGGWAESGRSLEVAIRMVRRLGGVVRGGFAVEGLIRDAGGKKVKGVKVRGEDDVMGDLVVVRLLC